MDGRQKRGKEAHQEYDHKFVLVQIVAAMDDTILFAPNVEQLRELTYKRHTTWRPSGRKRARRL